MSDRHVSALAMCREACDALLALAGHRDLWAAQDTVHGLMGLQNIYRAVAAWEDRIAHFEKECGPNDEASGPRTDRLTRRRPMTTGFYTIQHFDDPGGDLLLFEVRKSTVDDGLFPLRAFGPASLAACQRFIELVENGARDFEARELTVEQVKA